MLSPKLGFAYSLDSKNSTVIRGAFALFYIQTDLLDVSSASISNGVSRQFLVVVGPKFGNSNPAVQYPNSLSPFPPPPVEFHSIFSFAPTSLNPHSDQENMPADNQSSPNH